MLNGRLQDFAALSYYVAQFMMRVLRRAAPTQRSEHWTALSVRPDATKADPLDIPTLLFNTIARDYRCVAELGAGDGRRILAIKAEHPEIEAHGFDLAATYDPP